MRTTAEREPARVQDHATLGGVHPTVVAATALAVAMFGWHAWATLRGYFWQDDFRYMSLAATRPLGSLMFSGYGGHLMPVPFLLVWLLTAVAPMQYTVAVLPVLALQAVGYVLMWKLLVRLFGHRWAILVPFAVMVCSPLVFAPSLWWAYALQLIPLEVALLAALYTHVGYLQTGRRRQAALALLWTAVGLACWEKAVLIAPLIFGVTVALQEGGLLARLVIVLRRHRRLWIGYALLEIGYLVLFFSLVREANQSPLTAADLGRLALRMIDDTFLPGILGGPWQVTFEAPVALAVPPGWVRWVAWTVSAAVVVLGLRVGGRRAVVAWLVLDGYLACCVVLVAVLRLQLVGVGVVIGGDPRYVADAVPVAALCGALAFLRPVALRGQAASSDAAAPDPDAPAPDPDTAAAAEPDSDSGPAAARTGHRLRRLALPVLTAGLTVLFIGGAGLTAARMSGQAEHAAARQYIEHARAAFNQDSNIVLYDTEVPDEVMIWLFLDHRRASQVFAALPSPPKFDQPTDDLRILDRSGVPRPVTLVDPVPAPPGSDPYCRGYAVREEPVRIPLLRATPPGRRVIQLSYSTATSATGTLRAGDATFPVRFLSGLHYLYVVADGPLYQIDVKAEPGGAVCVGDVLVGAAVAP